MTFHRTRVGVSECSKRGLRVSGWRIPSGVGAPLLRRAVLGKRDVWSKQLAGHLTPAGANRVRKLPRVTIAPPPLKRWGTRRISRSRAPDERDRRVHVRVQALVNRAAVGGVFEALLGLLVQFLWHVDGAGEAADPSRGRADHFLGDPGGGAADVDVVAVGDDAHRRQDAGG